MICDTQTEAHSVVILVHLWNIYDYLTKKTIVFESILFTIIKMVYHLMCLLNSLKFD